MQTTINFRDALRAAFRLFVEQKIKEGYDATKVNYTACCTLLKKETYQISIGPSKDGMDVFIVEYQKGERVWLRKPAENNPDDFREGKWIDKWIRIRSYKLTTTQQ